MTAIKRTEIEDFPPILELLRQLWPGRELDAEAVRAVFVEALSSEDHVYFSACHDARIVGFASLRIVTSLRTAGPFGHVAFHFFGPPLERRAHDAATQGGLS